MNFPQTLEPHVSLKLFLGHLKSWTVCLLLVTAFSNKQVASLLDLRVSTRDSTREPLQVTESLDESRFLSEVFSTCFDGNFCCFTIVEHSCKPTDPESDGGTCFLLFSEDIFCFTVLVFVISLLGKPSGLLETKSSLLQIFILDLGTSCWPLRAGLWSVFAGY